MARAIDITCPPIFNTHGDPTSLGTNWKKWLSGFDLYLIAAGVTTDNQQKALLLHCGGEDLRELYQTLPPLADGAVGEDATEYLKVCTSLNTYFIPRQNKRYERHIFRSCAQEKNEPTSQYITRLRKLAKTCQFHDSNDEIVDQVIEKCSSSKLRKRLLKEQDLTLDKLLEIALIIESADRQADHYKNQNDIASHNHDSDDDEVNRLQSMQRKFQKSRISAPPYNSNNNNTICYRCGSKNHLANKCENAKGKTCHKCGKVGHFSNVCKSSQSTGSGTVRYIIADDDSSDDDFVLAINKKSSNDSLQKSSSIYPIKINGTTVDVLIDSGSSVNVISQSTYQRLSYKSKMHPITKDVFAFNANEPLEVNGYIWATLTSHEQSISSRVIVVPHAHTTPLSRP